MGLKKLLGLLFLLPTLAMGQAAIFNGNSVQIQKPNLLIPESGVNGRSFTLAVPALSATYGVSVPLNVCASGEAWVFSDGSGTMACANVIVDGDAASFSSVTIPSFTAGSVVFAGTAGLLSQNNANLFFDNASNELGIGTNSPAAALHVVSTTGPQSRFEYDSSNYLTNSVSSSGNYSLDAVGVTPNYAWFLNGSQSMSLDPQALKVLGSGPTITAEGSFESVYLGAESPTAAEVGVYVGVTNAKIATFNTGTGFYEYNGGGLFGDGVNVGVTGTVNASDLSASSSVSGSTVTASTSLITPQVKAFNSTGILFEADDGTDIATFGASTSTDAIFEGLIATRDSIALEDPGAGTDIVTLQAPTLSASYSLTLPVDDGASTQVLSTDGSGVLSWASALTSPFTTKGDIITTNDGTAIVRQGVGTNGQALVAASAETNGVKYSFGDVVTITNADSPYTLTTQTRKLIVNATSGAVTVNLPAASNSGYSVEIIKSDTSSNLVTIDPNSSETICGQTTVKMSGQFDAMTVVSDGTNMQSNDCLRSAYVLIDCGASSSIQVDIQKTTSSIGNISGGQCTITLQTGIFSSAPECIGQETSNNQTLRQTKVIPASATSIVVRMRSASATTSATSVVDPSNFIATFACKGFR